MGKRRKRNRQKPQGDQMGTGNGKEPGAMAATAEGVPASRRRGRPPKRGTILGGSDPAETILGRSQPPAVPALPLGLAQLAADLGEIEERRAGAKAAKQAPLHATRDRFLAPLASKKDVVEQFFARFNGWVPYLHHVIRLAADTWSPLDPCQLARRRAGRAAEEALNAITHDHIGAIRKEVEQLTPQQLQNPEWEAHILRRIGGLDGLEKDVEEKLATVADEVGRLKRYAPELVETLAVVRPESAPPAREAVTQFDPMQ